MAVIPDYPSESESDRRSLALADVIGLDPDTAVRNSLRFEWSPGTPMLARWDGFKVLGESERLQALEILAGGTR